MTKKRTGKPHHRKGRKPGPSKKKSSFKGKRPDSKPSNFSFKKEKVPEHLVEKALALTDPRLKNWLKKSFELSIKPYVAPKDPLEELDDWQREAVDALLENCNVIVDAPTTAGKTRVVEAFFSAHINDRGFRACYTTPVKSLANDKLKEFRNQFGEENVGISTGDIKDKLDAPVVVATLESYRNSLLGVEPDLKRKLVVFDEYHFLQDRGRGSAWEEAIILTPDDCQILMLSASLANGPEFANWLNKLQKKRCHFIEVEHRPVPLADLVYFGSDWVVPDGIPQPLIKKTRTYNLKPLPHEEIANRLNALVDLNLTPCIVYAGRRMACEQLARAIAKTLPPLSREEAVPIGEVLQKAHERSKALTFMNHNLRQMIQGYGVAFHHSGLAPPVRIAIEDLVKDGLLKFCTATMGLSLGINFSVRSTVISDFTRPGEGGITPYPSSEILQMLGRAGRRGKDAVGFSLWLSLEAYKNLGEPNREDASSQLKNDPTTFLGLIGRDFTLPKIESFYKKSFRTFTQPTFDLTLIHKERILKKLETDVLPCHSPANEFVKWWTDKASSLCKKCSHRKVCHRILESKCQGNLASMHLHLHAIGAIDDQEKLTSFGDIARYFPHGGGLLVAKMIADGRIHKENLLATSQFFGALSLARHKEPNSDPRYRFPFDFFALEDELQDLYPYNLFPDAYDPPFGRRRYPVLRDYNMGGGYTIYRWLTGSNWPELLKEATNQYFAQGDLTSLIYRTASYLQSIVQCNQGQLSANASQIRSELLREPLELTL